MDRTGQCGPPSHHRLRHRIPQTSDTDWTDHPHQGTSLTTVIGSLTPGADYQVRVLARNHEGQSPWSNPAQGTTVGAAMTATDADNDTLTYSITGPNPGGFTIDSTTAQLRSGPAESYDFEDPAKNTYTVTVTATDSRGASDSIPVTVTVTDVNEPPAFAESNPTRQLVENSLRRRVRALR